MAKISFSDTAATQLLKNGKKAIDDLLAVLNSDIIYPTDKEGFVKEERLLAVVKSREQVSITVFNLMELIQVDKSRDTALKNKLIKGFKNTFEQLNAIITRDIRIEYVVDEPEAEAAIEKLLNKLAGTGEDESESGPSNVSDDYLSSIAKAKETAYRICKMLIDKIALLEDADAVNNEKINNVQTLSIAERYAR